MDAVDAGTRAFWVDQRRTAPCVHNEKGSRMRQQTFEIAEYIRDNAPVRMVDVCRRFGIRERNLLTTLTSLTYLIPVYEDHERHVLDVIE